MSPMARLAAAIMSMRNDRGITGFNLRDIVEEIVAFTTPPSSF
jgi:hypothetical protein